MSNNQHKRKQYEQECNETVDDLAFAATFAIVPTVDNSPTKQESNDITLDSSSSTCNNETGGEGAPQNDDNIIQIDDERCNTATVVTAPLANGDTTEKSAILPIQENERISTNEDEESDECESDIDLSEALKQMDDEDSGDEGGKGKKKNAERTAPKTQNELDLYSCPIADLEKRLDLDLDLSNTLLFSRNSLGIMSSCVSKDRLKIAGVLKCHLVPERTIVVESNTEWRSAQSSLLDEGSLLVMIVNSEDKNFQDVMGEGAKQAEPNSCYIVPLGKVLEVFGPVTHPLYTVRLKSFEKNESEQKEDDTTERKEEDPWSSNGALTKLINSQPKMCIYYSEDHAKMVDTQSVVRNSGKGCDASNVYDEEVQNAKEMYFSDDEQEREFKRKGKQKKNQRGRHNETNIGTSGGRFQRSPRGGGSNFHNVSYNHSQAPPPPQSWQQPIQQGQSYNHASQYNQGATPNNTFYHIPNTYGNQQYQVQPNQYQVQPNQYQAQPNQYQVQPNQYNPVQPPQQHFHHPPAHQYQNYPNSNVGYPVPPPPNQGNSNPVGQYQNNNPNRGDVQGDRGEEENDTVYYNYSGPS